MAIDKKAVIRDYKEKKTPKGIFAVRCTPSGEVWVAYSTHLDTARNGLFFELNTGGHRNKALQAAWKTHGEAAFELQTVETFDDDLHPMLLKDLAKARQQHWLSELGALKV